MHGALLHALLGAGLFLASCGGRSQRDDVAPPDAPAPFVDPCWQTGSSFDECCSREGCGLLPGGNCATLLDDCPTSCAPEFICVKAYVSDPELGACGHDVPGEIYRAAFCAPCDLLPDGCS